MPSPKTEWEQFIAKRTANIAYFSALLGIIMMVLLLRIWYLQIIEHSYLLSRAENNRVREVYLDGHRGLILDRNGLVLVTNRPAFELSMIPEDMNEPKNTLEFLQKSVEFNMNDVLKSIKNVATFKKVVIKSDISRDEVAFVEENRLELPGVSLQIVSTRNYNYGNFASHLLGYLGPITAKQLARVIKKQHSRNDFVGQTGVERAFEKSLKGRKGLRVLEVDAAGRVIKVLKRISPIGGTNIQLTIDYETQKMAEESLKGKAGAIVAMDPNNGDVLAFASSPSFDPNIFSNGISAKNWSRLLKSGFHPLQNRVTQGQYPPGSTHKIVTAIAGLEEGVFDKNTLVNCPGYFKLGRKTFRCWKGVGHGSMDMKSALIQSCDVYFYTLGLKLGVDRIAKYARMVGFGSSSNFKVGTERKGLVPTIEWKEKVRKKPWVLGETVVNSIGQGYNLVTPIQQVRMVAAVANGGKMVEPKIIIKDVDLNNEKGEREHNSLLPFSKESMQFISESLRGVVEAPRGTAWRINKGSFGYAGKTGTAQVVRKKDIEPENIEDIKYKYRDHAWFVGYGPIENSEISVAVVVEHAGHGGTVAAPIAKKVMDAYLNSPYTVIQRSAGSKNRSNTIRLVDDTANN